MIRKVTIRALALISLVSTVGAEELQTSAERGAAVFALYCAPCHARLPENTSAPLNPGVQSLMLKYNGARSPYIEERPDLADAQVLKAFVRGGTGSMPPFRKTEVSDEDIVAIAVYLAETSAD